MRSLRKGLSILLTASMVTSMMSVTVFADESGFFGCGIAAHEHTVDCFCPAVAETTCGLEEHDHVAAACETPCEKLYDLTCTADVHKHSAEGGSCYTFTAHECVEGTCTVPCEQTGTYSFSCTLNEHEHSEEGGACYSAHVHKDACYTCGIPAHGHDTVACYTHVCDDACCTMLLPAHKHNAECLTEAAKAQITAMDEMLNGIPTEAEMQKARTTEFAVGNFTDENYTTENAAEYRQLAANAYKEYIDNSFAAREAAQEAYDEFPEELKQFVSADALKRLTDKLTPLTINTKTKAVKAPDGEYTWQFINQRYIRSNSVDWSGQWIQPFVLLDTTELSGTWVSSPGEFVPGVSNYEVVLCCDNGVKTHDGQLYKRQNLEDAEHYPKADAEHIRAIVMNCYPFVSIEETKENLISLGMDEDIVASLNRSDLVNSVYSSVWYYANYKHNNQIDGTPYPANAHLYKVTINNGIGTNASNCIVNYQNEYWDWFGTVHHYDSIVQRKVDALTNFLINLDQVALEDDQVVINKMEIDGTPVMIDAENGTYEVALKIVLNGSGSGNQDDIAIKVTAGANEVTVPVEYGKTEYVVSISASNGDEIKAEVSGTQVLPKGVYFYSPRPADVDKDGVATAREAGQNFVGVAVGDTAVYAADTLTFTVEEEILVPVSLGLQKTDLSGNKLTGAEFELAMDIDGDGKADPFKVYPMDENGFVQIDNLIPGKEYVLTEKTAPNGYVLLNGDIKFTTTEDGITYNGLPGGVSAADNDGLMTISVKNQLTPPPGGGSGGGGRDPEPKDPEIEIDEPEVPLTDLPVDLEDPEVPLAALPEEEDGMVLGAEDEGMVLGEEDEIIAATGDPAALWLALGALSGSGLFLLRKKRED